MKPSLALAALVLSGASLVAAQTPAAPLPDAASATPAQAGPSKIAVIAFQVAVAKTNEFQRNYLDLQKKWAPRQQSLKTRGEEVDNQSKQLEAQAGTLSDAERASRAKALEDKRKSLEREVEDARNDYQQDLQGVIGATEEKLYDVMRDYAEKNGFTIVLDDATQTNPVLYAIETTDITKPVVDAYNVKSGVPAPPPQPADAPAPAAKPAAK